MTVADVRAQTANGGQEPPARSVSFLAFTLRLVEPGGVTVPGKGPDEAQVVLDTGIDGHAQLPGTSLAGALRELVSGRRGKDVAGKWFGRIAHGADDDAQASQVWVLGSRRLDDAASQFLSSTRIDRARGAAAARGLAATAGVLVRGALAAGQRASHKYFPRYYHCAYNWSYAYGLGAVAEELRSEGGGSHPLGRGGRRRGCHLGRGRR